MILDSRAGYAGSFLSGGGNVHIKLKREQRLHFFSGKKINDGVHGEHSSFSTSSLPHSWWADSRLVRQRRQTQQSIRRIFS